MPDPLRDEVDAFLRITGMSPTQFSIRVTKDRHFVRGLRAGRRVLSDTAENARAYMRQFDPAVDPVPRRGRKRSAELNTLDATGKE